MVVDDFWDVARFRKTKNTRLAARFFTLLSNLATFRVFGRQYPNTGIHLAFLKSNLHELIKPCWWSWCNGSRTTEKWNFPRRQVRERWRLPPHKKYWNYFLKMRTFFNHLALCLDKHLGYGKIALRRHPSRLPILVIFQHLYSFEVWRLVPAAKGVL